MESVDEMLGKLYEVLGNLGADTTKPAISLDGLKITAEQERVLKTKSYSKIKKLINSYLREGDYNKLEYIVNEIDNVLVSI